MKNIANCHIEAKTAWIVYATSTGIKITNSLVNISLTNLTFISDMERAQLSFSQKQPPKKKRKSRTAFTNHQIFELEKRFLYQKYLSPADRDEIAAQLGLTNAQVGQTFLCGLLWGGFLKIIPIGIPTYAGMKTGF